MVWWLLPKSMLLIADGVFKWLDFDFCIWGEYQLCIFLNEDIDFFIRLFIESWRINIDYVFNLLLFCFIFQCSIILCGVPLNSSVKIYLIDTFRNGFDWLERPNYYISDITRLCKAAENTKYTYFPEHRCSDGVNIRYSIFVLVYVILLQTCIKRW